MSLDLFNPFPPSPDMRRFCHRVYCGTCDPTHADEGAARGVPDCGGDFAGGANQPCGEGLTKRERATLVFNAPYQHIPCSRCGASAGEPCKSSLGNTTLPHMARKEAAEKASQHEP